MKEQFSQYAQVLLPKLAAPILTVAVCLSLAPVPLSAQTQRPAPPAIQTQVKKPLPVTVKKPQGFPYYTMTGFYQSLCLEPPERVFRGCKKVSTMHAAAAASFLIYYGNLIGKDSVIVVVPRSKLGTLAGEDMSAKLIEMTHRFGAENRNIKK